MRIWYNFSIIERIIATGFDNNLNAPHNGLNNAR